VESSISSIDTIPRPMKEDLDVLSREELVRRLEIAFITIEENGRGTKLSGSLSLFSHSYSTDLTMAAQVGQQLLKVNQSLKKAYDQLVQDVCSSNQSPLHSMPSKEAPYTMANHLPLTSSPFRTPVKSNPPPSTPKTPQFDLHSYIDSIEALNQDLRQDVDRLSTDSVIKTRQIQKLEKEVSDSRQEIQDLQDTLSHLQADSRLKQHAQLSQALGSIKSETEVLLNSLYSQIDLLTHDKDSIHQSHRALQIELQEAQFRIETLEDHIDRNKKCIATKDSEIASLRRLLKQQKRESRLLRGQVESEREERLKSPAHIIDRVLGPCEEVSRPTDSSKSPSRWTSLRSASSEPLVAQFWNPDTYLPFKGNKKDLKNCVKMNITDNLINSVYQVLSKCCTALGASKAWTRFTQRTNPTVMMHPH
jgi:hypothetical protein